MIKPIAYYHGPFGSKFGIPRQSGMSDVEGRIVFEPEYRCADALRGLDGFSHLWLIWEFSANRDAKKSPTVRPPILGGNERMGVWATRSPFRPNNLGLSSVRIIDIRLDDADGPVIIVGGADLMDGTPVFDIKPYIPHTDCHPDARCGFAAPEGWRELRVVIPDDIRQQSPLSAHETEALRQALALDPRPHYQDDPARIYGLPFAGTEVRFKVAADTLTVCSILPSDHT